MRRPGQAAEAGILSAMLPFVAAIAAALGVVLSALLFHRLSWREQLVADASGCQLRGRIAGPGEIGAPVATLDVRGCAEASAALSVRAGEQSKMVDIAGAQLELRWRPGRGADLRIGDRIAVWGIQQPGGGLCNATRVLRAGWPGLLPLCLIATLAATAAISSYRLARPSGCPEGTRPRVRRERSLVEHACVRDDGKRHGPALETTHGGRRLAQGAYSEGKKTGLWRRYYRNLRVAEEISYAAGRRHGPWRRYAPDGTPIGRAEMQQGRGVFEVLHTNGAVAERGTIIDGERHGLWRFWRSDGSRASEGSYRHGKKQGEWKSWHEGGKLAWEGSFARGKRHGRWRSFSTDGKKEKEGAFTAGKRDGLWRFYHPNGKLARRGSFTDGKEEGPWTLFDEKGQTQIEGHYQRGLRVGKWRWHCGRCKDCDVCGPAQRSAGEAIEKDYGPAASRPAAGAPGGGGP